MKINFRHGIVYRHKNCLLPNGNNVRLEVASGASVICAFLKRNRTTLVWLDESYKIEWKLSNKSNKIFLEYDEGKVKPLTIEVDGTDYSKSGSKLPRTAPNGSTFYNITDNQIYLMVSGRWQARCVIHLGTVTGNRIILAPIGTQIGAFSSEVVGVDLLSQDGVSIRGAATMDLYELNAPNYIVCNEDYEAITVSPNPNKIPRFSAVGYDGNKLNRANFSRPAIGIVLEESDGMCLVCHSGKISNILLNLPSGKVFYDDFGTLTSRPTKGSYHEIGTYDAIKCQLTIEIKDKEYII